MKKNHIYNRNTKSSMNSSGEDDTQQVGNIRTTPRMARTTESSALKLHVFADCLRVSQPGLECIIEKCCQCDDMSYAFFKDRSVLSPGTAAAAAHITLPAQKTQAQQLVYDPTIQEKGHYLYFFSSSGRTGESVTRNVVGRRDPAATLRAEHDQ